MFFFIPKLVPIVGDGCNWRFVFEEYVSNFVDLIKIYFEFEIYVFALYAFDFLGKDII